MKRWHWVVVFAVFAVVSWFAAVQATAAPTGTLVEQWWGGMTIGTALAAVAALLGAFLEAP
jgi:hypothetical protein